MSRHAILYYLAALGCGLVLSACLPLFFHAVRRATGARRRLLGRVLPVSTLLFPALWLLFRVTAIRMGLGGEYGAPMAVPLLLGLPMCASIYWYFHKYGRIGRTESGGDGGGADPGGL